MFTNHASYAQSVTSLKPLWVEGNVIRTNSGPYFLVGFNDGGDVGGGHDYGDPDFWTYAPENAKLFRSMGINTVTIPLRWNRIEIGSDPQQFTYDQDYLRKISSTVGIYQQYGIYTILRVMEFFETNHPESQYVKNIANVFRDSLDEYYHPTDAWFVRTDVTSPREHIMRGWVAISNHVKDIPGVAGYSLWNTCFEPGNTGGTPSAYSSQQIHDFYYSMQSYIISNLRANGDNKIVFVGEGHWQTNYSRMIIPISDNNVVYSGHFYEGTTGDASARGGFSIAYNGLSDLRAAFYQNTRIGGAIKRFPDLPFYVIEYGHVYRNSEGDAKDIYLQNLHTMFQENPNLSGWAFWGFHSENGAPRSIFPYDRSTFPKRVVESMASLPAQAKAHTLIVKKTRVSNAAVLAHDVPGIMSPGQAFTVHVTVLNSGTTTWTAANNYKLIPVDGSIGFRPDSVKVDAGSAVAPGQEYTFTFTINAPTLQGSYTVRYQMFQELVGNFGQTVTVPIVVS